MNLQNITSFGCMASFEASSSHLQAQQLPIHMTHQNRTFNDGFHEGKHNQSQERVPAARHHVHYFELHFEQGCVIIWPAVYARLLPFSPYLV
jgi:hypothetical protein